MTGPTHPRRSYLILSTFAIILQLLPVALCNVKSSSPDPNAVPLARTPKNVEMLNQPEVYPLRPFMYERLRQPLLGMQRSGLYANIPLDGVYDPFSLVAIRPGGEIGVVPGNGRSRRNSIASRSTQYAGRHRPRDYYYYRQKPSEINDIYAMGPRQASYSQYGNSRVGVNPNQFLTKQQVEASHTRYSSQGPARYYGNPARDRKRDNGSNNYYGRYHGVQQSNNIDNNPNDEILSIQVGTQLKVNHDDRQKNPDRFYVQDESGAQSYRRPSSYRSK